MENEKSTENQVLSGKIGGYNPDYNNFVCPGELTVQITLNEYRKLIEENATAQHRIDKADMERIEKRREADQLKKENAELKDKIIQLAGGKTTQDAPEEDEDG